MAFLLPILEGVGSGLLGGAVGGALGGGIGGAENGVMNGLNAQDETFQLGIYASEVRNQEQMQLQSEIFDQMMNERSENMREIETVSQDTSPLAPGASLAALYAIGATLRPSERVE